MVITTQNRNFHQAPLPCNAYNHIYLSKFNLKSERVTLNPSCENWKWEHKIQDKNGGGGRQAEGFSSFLTFQKEHHTEGTKGSCEGKYPKEAASSFLCVIKGWKPEYALELLEKRKARSARGLD